MASFSEQLSGIAPWRRAVTVMLLIVAIAIFVLAVANVIHVAAIIGGAVVVGLSYLVGPRSPFFKSSTS